MASNPSLHSFHAFLFPFEWQRKGSDQQPLEEQINLHGIIKLMGQTSGDWDYVDSWLKPKTLVQYNEANYFYDFVRPMLYGDKDAQFQVYFQHKEAAGSEYVIEMEDGTVYRLELDAVGVSFYNMGVGLLSFHCYNRQYEKQDDILKINQFGRRLFPPFFGVNTDHVGTQAYFEETDWLAGLQPVMKNELAASLRLEKGGAAWATDNFDDWKSNPELDKLPGLLRQILPRALYNQFRLTPVLDDRMFVVCWYGNDLLATELKEQVNKEQYNDWWYKFTFVDGENMTCQNGKMARELLDRHSYLRWSDYRTFYGVSRYSLVCLTSSLETLQKPYINAAFLPAHIQTVYYKLAELTLVQRACVLRFSEEVTAIANFARERAVADLAGSLTRQYIRFINKVYFREVTAQEQGIELYDLLQKHMRLDNQVKDLDGEIQELHQYVALQEEDIRNEKLDVLTYIGAFFVVPSFVCGYLGINDFNIKENLTGTAFLCLFSALSFLGIIRCTGLWRWVFIVASAVLMMYVLFVFPVTRFE